jgi:ribosomal protein L7Ae-like RNA K-turn-binding protein
VRDALEKGRVEMLLFARDISEGTKEKVAIPAASIPHAALFSRDEFGRLLNREMIGVIGIEDKGLADAILKETGRLKGLIKTSD